MQVDYPETRVPLPVADIALMTGITVVLTALIGTFVFGLAALL